MERRATDEFRIPFGRLRNSKDAGGDGLPAELFHQGCEELARCTQQLLCASSDESMPADWNLMSSAQSMKKETP